MKLDIPFISQYSDSFNADWQPRSCAIACIAMLLDFYNVKIKPMDLVEEGLSISKKFADSGKALSGYTEEFGWGHDVLVILLCGHGMPAYRQEFRGIDDKLMFFGIEKIKKQISSKNPVIVSIAKDINNPRSSGHLVLATGFEEAEGNIKGLYINDPEAKNQGEGGNKFVDISDFKKAWKRLAIFAEK